MKRIFTISGLVLLCFLFMNAAIAQSITVKGKVTDAKTGETLVGVSVAINGTTTGTQTDVNGSFSISAPSNATLKVSYLGYTTQQVAINGQSSIDIKLESSTNELAQVVVIGYGTQRKIDVTGSVSQVKGAEISKQSSTNPVSALQGKVAGLQITNNGTPGSSPTVRIRGTGTVLGNANPLYVVDGVWYDDINFLNPSDIEDISVLKDASSEAIYGIRAANGVILVTTKKGTKNSKPVISYDGLVGNQVVTNEFKMATGPEYATLVNELDAIGGATPRYADPSKYGTTDWNHQILRNAMLNNHHLSVMGGGENSTYNIAFGYTKQDGLVKNNTFDRYTLRATNDYTIFKNFKVGYTFTGAYTKSHDVNGSIFHELYAAVPIVPVYYADGTYGDPNDFNVTSSALFNPQVDVDYARQVTTTYQAKGSAYAELKFLKHFTFRTSAGGDFDQGEVHNYVPVYTATFSQRNTLSSLTLSDYKTRNWILDNLLTYDNTFGDHSLTVLVGQEAQSYRYNGLVTSAENVPDYGNGQYLSQGNNYKASDIGDGFPAYSTVSSYFGRVSYRFKNRYLLNATMRADGSSKFTGSQRWGYFPSIGAGWVITEEDFMKNQHLFDNLKLRGSWGVIGNMSVPANISTTTVNTGFYYVTPGSSGNPYVGPGANIDQLTPPVTYWEKTKGYNFGIDFSILNSRLAGTVEYYNKQTDDAIFAIPVLGSLGAAGATVVGNQATIRNQGVEVQLTWRDKIGQDFNYSISGNVGINNNKVTKVLSGSNPIYAAVSTTGSNNFNTRTVVGEPIGEFVGLKSIGVFQTQQEIDDYKKGNTPIMPNAVPGDLKFQDINNDGVIDDKDRVVLGNPNPKYVYGVSTYFQYKNFDLSVDLQGVAGVQIYDANFALRYGTENFSQDFFDHRWHGPGTSNTYPSTYIAGGQNNRSNSFYVQDGSYMRIRNLQLGYTLPVSLTNKWKVNKLRVYANAQNAFNFFKYKGFSPEVGGGPTTAGVDANVYPLSATYNVGVNLTF